MWSFSSLKYVGETMLSCTVCAQKKPKSHFSKSQCKKGSQKRKCKECNQNMTAHYICSMCHENKPSANFSKEQIKNNKTCKQSVSKYFPILEIMKLDNYNFIMLSRRNTIHIYHSINNKWSTPENMQNLEDKKSITVDYNEKHLYILSEVPSDKPHPVGILSKYKYHYNVKSAKFSCIPCTGTIEISLKTKQRVFTRVVDNLYHMILPSEEEALQISTSSHLIYDLDKNIKKDEYILTTASPNNYDHFFLYMPKKQQLLRMELSVKRLSAKRNPYRTVRMFSIENKIWTNGEEMKINRQSGRILTVDERYMISFGGYRNCEILIVDLESCYADNATEYKVMKSIMKCPLNSTYHALLTEVGGVDDLLILGYFRKCWLIKWKVNVMNIPILPLEIVNFIGIMVGGDLMVHLFTRDSGLHYEIELRNELKYKVKNQIKKVKSRW